MGATFTSSARCNLNYKDAVVSLTTPCVEKNPITTQAVVTGLPVVEGLSGNYAHQLAMSRSFSTQEKQNLLKTEAGAEDT